MLISFVEFHVEILKDKPASTGGKILRNNYLTFFPLGAIFILRKAWTSLYMDRTAVKFFLVDPTAHIRRKFGTKITPWGWIFWTMNFFNLF